MVKQSDYDIVEQLRRTTARISLLSQSSEIHRNAIQKILNETYVSPCTSVDAFATLVNQIKSITFTEDEISPIDQLHPRALHITVKTREFTVATVLIDK